MAFKQLLSIVGFASVLLLDHTTKVYACSCFLPPLCENFQESDVVVHGTALSRTEQVDGLFSTATYTISIKTIYKGEPDMTNGQEIEVATAINGDMCGVELVLDEEYLLGIYEGRDGRELTMHLCGLHKRWSFVSDEDKANMEAGCDYDPCDYACDEFQECLQYERNDKWYCSDTCDNDPCAEDERCTTRAKKWCRNSGRAGCPEKRKCR